MLVKSYCVPGKYGDCVDKVDPQRITKSKIMVCALIDT